MMKNCNKCIYYFCEACEDLDLAAGYLAAGDKSDSELVRIIANIYRDAYIDVNSFDDQTAGDQAAGDQAAGDQFYDSPCVFCDAFMCDICKFGEYPF